MQSIAHPLFPALFIRWATHRFALLLADPTSIVFVENVIGFSLCPNDPAQRRACSRPLELCWDSSISILGSDTQRMNSFPTGLNIHFLPVE